MPQTMEDLELARAELATLEERDSMDTSGNPDKYHARIRAARRHVRNIEAALKASGIIPYTEEEQLEQQIDAAFPNADNHQIVEFEGARFQLRFHPLSKSRSGKTVLEWGKSWVKLSNA